MDEIIPMGRVNQRLVQNIAIVLERGVAERHHELIAAHLPFMVNKDHLEWCVGGVWGFTHVVINTLKEISKDPNCIKFNSSQQRMFKKFLDSVKKGRDLITLHVWYANDTNWQIKFTRASNGDYVPCNAWIDDYNVFDKIITDCATHFETTRAEILKTWEDVKENG